MSLEIPVPDIGDFTDVPVVEVLVSAGDEVEAEAPLIVLESDKASMEVPSPQAGTIGEVRVSVGDTVSQGTVIATLQAGGEEGEGGGVHAQVLVLGSGPGGYTAAFRAADLGLDVVLVERYPSLGGVCLNVGCIPSKALLHVAKVIAEAEATSEHGVSFGAPQIDLDALRTWKDGVVQRLTGGVGGMAKQRRVRVLEGTGRFTGPHALEVDQTTVTFDHAIVAAGSRAIALAGIPYEDARVMDSTDALELAEIPERLLVIGGGIIGLELACVYDALGSQVTVVELADQLIPGCDPDLIEPLRERIAGRYAAIHLSTRVEAVEARDDGLHAIFTGDVEDAVFDRILVAVGREPNGADFALDAAGVHVDARGFVPVDQHQRTNVEHIFAIGDVVGGPMLAHKATHEGKVAAEVIAGHDVIADARGIPAVAYTDPEVAWVGLSEVEAEKRGTPYETASFPWQASGRALSMQAPGGLTKLLVDPQTRRVIGAGIVGANAGELISETTLALEMGADAQDVGLTVHAHPTLSETVAFAAEVAEGTVTDLPPRRR
ncbi:MAG TPA: dihydrolipoyl dehydrogenase [Solirubrobacteraceae bacterium]|nr:dihydrolipoyl dehydrogenase [Solirubrobacteraceae bacterium]